MPGKEVFGSDYPRLFIALQYAGPGELLFIQLNSPVQRRQLPEQLKADGLQRPFAVADFSTFSVGPPPYGVLREFLEDLPSPVPAILFVDGLEHWVDADPETIQALNLGRERLANLGVVVVFLLPAYVINLIRSQALNLWSWRAHYYSLESREASPRSEDMLLAVNTGYPIAPSDTPEARDRRIRILQRLLEEGLAEHRTLDSLARSVLFPLVHELYNAGRFTEALEVLEQFRDDSQRFGDILDKAVMLSWKGIVLQSLGMFAEAELSLTQAITNIKEILGPNDRETAQAFNNLAGLYLDQGRYAEAKLLLQKALKIWEKVQASDCPEVANVLNNLAVLHLTQGKYAEAELLFQQSLRIDEKTLGPNHPVVADTLGNRAVLYRKQGRYAEAELLAERALKIQEHALGSEHPSVASSLNNLAVIYEQQGKYTEAEALYQQALTLRNVSLGPEHPDVATLLENYAALLRKTNHVTKAAELDARAQAIRAKHAQENLTSQPS